MYRRIHYACRQLHISGLCGGSGLMNRNFDRFNSRDILLERVKALFLTPVDYFPFLSGEFITEPPGSKEFFTNALTRSHSALLRMKLKAVYTHFLPWSRHFLAQFGTREVCQKRACDLFRSCWVSTSYIQYTPLSMAVRAKLCQKCAIFQ